MIIATVFPFPEVGGLSSHVKTLIRMFEGRGVSTTVVSWTNTPRIGRTANRGLSAAGNLVLGNGGGTYLNHGNRIRFLRHTLRSVLQHDDSVMSVQDCLSAIAAREAGFRGRLVLTVHGYFAQELRSKGKLSRDTWFERFMAMEAKGYLAADEIVTVDSRIYDYVKQLAPNVPCKVLFNAPGSRFIDSGSSRTGTRNEKIELLLPRRLTAKNGVLVACDILFQLRARGRDAHLTLAGDGELRNEMQTKLASLGLAQNVTFLGNINEDRMVQQLRNADVVIVPSVPHHGVIEATSIAALEAMAIGVPVVASAIGGLAEVIQHDRNGKLAPPGDAEAFADEVAGLVDNSTLYSEISSAGRDFAKMRFADWESAMQEIYRG